MCRVSYDASCARRTHEYYDARAVVRARCAVVLARYRRRRSAAHRRQQWAATSLAIEVTRLSSSTRGLPSLRRRSGLRMCCTPRSRRPRAAAPRRRRRRRNRGRSSRSERSGEPGCGSSGVRVRPDRASTDRGRRRRRSRGSCFPRRWRRPRTRCGIRGSSCSTAPLGGSRSTAKRPGNVSHGCNRAIRQSSRQLYRREPFFCARPATRRSWR